MKKTKSLVTGVNGFVGSHLAEYLLSKQEGVYGFKRLRSSLDNIKNIAADIKLYDVDLLDMSSIIRSIKEIRPDYIYHLAAQSFIPAGFTLPQYTLEVNTTGTLNLLEAIRILGISPAVLITSSSDVYGEVKKSETPIDENAQFKPVTTYGVSKAGQDLLGYQYFVSYGIKTIRTRALSHTGPRRGENFAESSFAKQIAQIEAGQKDPVITVGNLNSLRTFLDVRDIVIAYRAIIRKGDFGEAYNVGGEQTLTIGRVLDLLLSMSTSKKIKVKTDKNLIRKSDKIIPILDTNKIRKITGWKPQIKIEKTLADLLNWWRNA